MFGDPNILLKNHWKIIELCIYKNNILPVSGKLLLKINTIFRYYFYLSCIHVTDIIYHVTLLFHSKSRALQKTVPF